MRLSILRLIAAGIIFVTLPGAISVFGQTGGIKGRCTGTRGEPLGYYTILIERQEIRWTGRMKTNKNGGYLYIGLAPGTYKLTLLSNSGDPVSSTITRVEIGEPTVADFDMAKGQFTDLKELFDHGLALYTQKRYIEAAQIFEQALPLAKDKNVPLVLAHLADSYAQAAAIETSPEARKQELERARENYQKALALDPQNASVRANYDRLLAETTTSSTPKLDYKNELTTTPPARMEDVDQPPVTRTRVPHAYGLVIAVEKYLPPLPPVPFAGADAAVVKRYFIRAFGIPEEHVKGLADPTLGQMRVGVNWLINQAKSDPSNETMLYVYYAGHGVGQLKTRSPYLLPIDADPSDVAETGLSLKELAGSLGALKGRSLLLIDACFSGAASRARTGEATGLTGGARPAYVEVDMPENPNVIIFSASTGEQLSNMLEPAQHGLFTYYLLSGLNGKAVDAAGQVTLRSLYEYVQSQVRTAAQRMNREQEPTLSPRLEVLGDTAGIRLLTLAR